MYLYIYIYVGSIGRARTTLLPAFQSGFSFNRKAVSVKGLLPRWRAPFKGNVVQPINSVGTGNSLFKSEKKTNYVNFLISLNSFDCYICDGFYKTHDCHERSYECFLQIEVDYIIVSNK